eukprot:COSAG03_NODE_7053_length_970_cov_1.071183_2_plen_170_part_00
MMSPLLAVLLLLLQPSAATVTTSDSVSEGSDRNCTTGVLDRDGAICCAKKCGKCAGTSCQDHPGGRSSCCSSSIEKSQRYCDSTGPPCVMGSRPPPPAPLRPAHKVNPKRGYVADSPNCDDALLLNASGWFYDYNAVNPCLHCSNHECTASFLCPAGSECLWVPTGRAV